MLSTSLVNGSGYLKTFTGFLKMYEQLRLLLNIRRSNHTGDSAYISYLKASTKKGGNIVLVGSQKKEDLFFIRRLMGTSGKLVSLIDEPHVYTVISDMVHILQWKNILVEKIDIDDCGCFYPTNEAKRDGAIVVDFNRRELKQNIEATSGENLSSYFAKNAITPDVLKINLQGGEYALLVQSRKFLQQHKPVLIVECDHRFTQKSVILDTFKWLTNLHYRGFFFLDTLKISIRNFDFDIYQNTSKDFYCSTFVFE